MKLRIMGNRVLVKELGDSQVKSSILYIPDSSKGLTQEGIVEDLGNCLQFMYCEGDVNRKKTQKVKMYLRVGDKIFFGRRAVKEIKVNGETRLLMSQDNVYGVIND